jgi:alkylhydroperoxidase family enzyme
LQGEQYSQTAAALRDGNLDAADITPAQRLLLQFVETLTRHAYRITDEQVEGLREAGWSDSQIAEAVYDGTLFNLFVRLADAFDIHPDPSYDAAGIPRAVTASDDARGSPGGGP